MKGKILGFIFAAVLVFISVFAVSCTPEQDPKDTITILYTNDIHAYINNDSDEEPGLSYASLAQLKADLGENVLLFDAGDHIQGSVFGAMDEGASVLEIMDEIYDGATLGNHEFDYGTERTLSIINNSKYPYLSCNFVYKDSRTPVISPYAMYEIGNVKIGVVGITTPETMASTAPSYFQDENGNYIYDFLDGQELYYAVQSAVNALKEWEVDYIIALGHIGVDSASSMTSRKIIENVTDLDAFIDGHSHSEIEKELVKDKDGNEVLLTQTGSYFSGVGKMTLSEDGITAEIIKSYDKKDETVLAAKDAWVAEVDAMLGEKIGTIGNSLSIADTAGKRVVRVDAAAIGDFVADAYYYYVNEISGINADVAIINGGGLRADIKAGEVSYYDLKSVNPFGNMLCAVELTGQQILDMLEWGARSTTGTPGEYEEGAFLHVSGLKYSVDTSITSSVQEDDKGIWTAAPTGEYRVFGVSVYDKASGEYKPLDLAKTYTMAGANFTLVSQGDGFNMLSGKTLKDYIVEDYMALAAYAIAFEDADNDGLSDIESKNSPLSTYAGFGINYESASGAERINVE